jgi:sigma-B regulation protein RsbU (phosphoserine phosphatase)
VFLCGDMAEGFVTLFFARVDPRTQMLMFCGAGHAGYLLDPEGTCTELTSTNMPLGINSAMEISCSTPQPMVPGPILVPFTDGVAETVNPVGEAFGTDRASERVRAKRDASAEDIASALFQAVREFAHDRSQTDDVTVLVLKIRALSSER